MTVPYLHKCAKCGESWWDAHVCATDVKIKPHPDSLAVLFPPSKPKAAQPDCRTCHYYAGLEGCFNGTGCTNGDKYQPAPKVVLWRMRHNAEITGLSG